MRSCRVDIPPPRFSQRLSENDEIPHQTYYNDEEFLDGGVQNPLDDAEESDSFY